MDIPKIFGIEFADECFPKNWLGSSVPVIFDFTGTTSVVNEKNNITQLFCIFPVQLGWLTIFAEISRKALIKSIINGEWEMRYEDFVNVWVERNKLREQQSKLEIERRQVLARKEFNQRLFGRKSTGRRRRF